MNVKDIPETLEDLVKFNTVSENNAAISHNFTFL